MYLDSDHATIVPLNRMPNLAQRLVSGVRRGSLSVALAVSNRMTGTAATALAAVWLLLGLVGNAFDEAAANAVLPETAHHAIWWHRILHEAGWFAGANIAVGVAVIALASFIAAHPKAQIIPFRRRKFGEGD
jgi:hypothetical protein